MNNIYILVALLLIINSCSPKEPVELEVIPLTLQRQPYSGDELKVDGYYFYEWESDVTSLTIFFLYKNGILIYGADSPKSEIINIEEDFRNGTWYKISKEKRIVWGVFQINNNNNTIKLEYWYPPGAGSMYYQPYIFGGEILNDTTFILTEQYIVSSNGTKDLLNTFSRTYHFKKFSPKPDSTNSFFE